MGQRVGEYLVFVHTRRKVTGSIPGASWSFCTEFRCSSTVCERERKWLSVCVRDPDKNEALKIM